MANPTLDLADLAAGPTVVVVAHPDDDVLGCGALLARCPDVRVVFVTNGAPQNDADALRLGFASRTAYAFARRAEAEAALALAGVRADQVFWLGISDQYVSRHLAEVALALHPLLALGRFVLTHTFEGGHSDHDAVAYAVHAACRHIGSAAPTLVEMPFYHAGPDGWVRQRFLPHPEAGHETVLVLTPDDRALKAQMVATHPSQADTLRSFALDAERFRVAPAYDFLARPHNGSLLYEQYGWNLTWPDWVARVAPANVALGFGVPACS